MWSSSTSLSPTLERWATWTTRCRQALLQIGTRELCPDDTGAHKGNKKRVQKNTGEGSVLPIRGLVVQDCMLTVMCVQPSHA